jgi:hypothetical protein
LFYFFYFSFKFNQIILNSLDSMNENTVDPFLSYAFEIYNLVPTMISSWKWQQNIIIIITVIIGNCKKKINRFVRHDSTLFFFFFLHFQLGKLYRDTIPHLSCGIGLDIFRFMGRYINNNRLTHSLAATLRHKLGYTNISINQ